MAETHRQAAPTFNGRTEVWTYRDAVDRVLDLFDDSRSNRFERTARAAVVSAARKMPTLHEWKCFRRRAVINAVASQSSSTVTYDHTGGAYERMLTLAAGTWPAWAEFGEVRINNNVYQVESRQSDTVITLDERANPGSDLAAGTSYLLFRSRYPLPIDFRRMDSLYRNDRSSALPSSTPENVFGETMCGYGPTGTVTTLTVMSHAKYLGGMAVQLSPAPNTAQTVMFQYWRMRPLRVLEYNTGTASVTGTALTVAGGALTSDHLGCIIRFSADGTTAPTSVLGNHSDVFNPAVHEATIVSITNSTTAVLDAAPPSSLSAVKYTISDPIDIFAPTMYDAFLSCAAYQFARDAHREDVNRYEKWFANDLAIAQDGDRFVTDIKDAATAWHEYHGWSLGTVSVT